MVNTDAERRADPESAGSTAPGAPQFQRRPSPVGRFIAARLAAGLRHPILRLVSLAAIAAALFWAASGYAVTPTALRGIVDDWGLVAPIAYGAVGAGLIVAFVPLAVVSGLAGLFFGPAIGFPVALAAATSGAGITFLLSRWLGGSAIDELQGQRLAAMRAWITERGLPAVVMARIAPIPTSVVNYGSGLTALPFRAFVVGSLLGFMPRVLAYVAVGGSLDDPASPAMIGALLLLAVVIIGGAIYIRRNRRARALTLG